MADAAVIAPKSANPIYRTIDILLRKILRVVPPSPFAEWIARSWGDRYQPQPSVVRLGSGASIQTTHVDHLQLLLYYCGTFEPHCLAILHQYVKPGDTFIDVGANIGLFTVEGALAVGPSGRVLSIEAAPTHAASVRKTCLINKFGNVEFFPVAVVEEDGQATLTLPRGTNLGMFTLVQYPAIIVLWFRSERSTIL